MFKQFDIDYNKVTINGIEIPKPISVSVGDWDEFWKQVDGESNEERVSIAFREGAEEAEKDHDEEIEQIKAFCAKKFKQLNNEFERLLRDDALSIDEKSDRFSDCIVESNEEIWRL